MDPLQIATLSYAITIILNCTCAALFFYFNPIKKEKELAVTIQYFMVLFATTTVAYIVFLGEIWTSKTLSIIIANLLFTIGFYSIRYAFLWRKGIKKHLYQDKFFYLHVSLFIFIQTYFFHIVEDNLNYRIAFGLFNYIAILLSCLPAIAKNPLSLSYGEKVTMSAIAISALLLTSALFIHLFELHTFVYQTSLMIVQSITALFFLGAFQTLLLSDISDLHYKNSITDQLTGLYNRRFFITQANKILKSAQRHDFPIALIMCDLDHFKKINDRYGHDVGDKVLQSFSKLLTTIIRETDTLSRYGGEEFAILLPQTSEQGATILAERMRNETEKMTILTNQRKIKFTASFGIAAINEKVSFEEGLKASDSALYQAKAFGRNRVCIYQPTD